jgi:5-formyltetrahydrofolate cyclo-ligase
MKRFNLLQLFKGQRHSATDRKKELRKKIRDQRKKMSESEHAKLSDAICEVALLSDEVSAARTIALYAARSTEPNTNLLLTVLSGRSKTVLLPVLGEKLSQTWAKFISLDDLEARIPDRPPEPSSHPMGTRALELADIILAPALAVDTAGNRLGYGGGWYDRVLLKKRPGVKVFALVFDSEVYEADQYPLPAEEHDQLIDGFITPTRFVRLDHNPPAEIEPVQPVSPTEGQDAN